MTEAEKAVFDARVKAAQAAARNAQMQGMMGVGAAGTQAGMWAAVVGIVALFAFGLLAR